jgi:hypothetical protein
MLMSLYQDGPAKAMALEQQLAEDYALLDKTTATNDMSGCSWCFYAYHPLNAKESQGVYQRSVHNFTAAHHLYLNVARKPRRSFGLIKKQ